MWRCQRCSVFYLHKRPNMRLDSGGMVYRLWISISSETHCLSPALKGRGHVSAVACWQADESRLLGCRVHSFLLVIPYFSDSEMFRFYFGFQGVRIRPFRIGGDGLLLSSISPGLPLLNLHWQAIDALGVFKTGTAHLKRSSFRLLKRRSHMNHRT